LYSQTYLDSSSKTEDAIVCLLLWKTLEREQDGLGFFGDQIISPARQQLSALSYVDYFD
jgi:hypothetical protein